ncbi:MAG: sulfatase-like hydrolase/transferase [Candidatus Eisenbacteria bacterium]|nr:sulfatase-like hydrolase/transferase [Candidatus Eisenbacteria bacterium]
MQTRHPILESAFVAAAVGFGGGVLESVLITFLQGYYFHTVRSFAAFVLLPGAAYAAAGLVLGAVIGWLLSIIRRGRSPVPAMAGAATLVLVMLVATATIDNAGLAGGAMVGWGAAGLALAIVLGGVLWIASHRFGPLCTGSVAALVALVAGLASGLWSFGPGGSGMTPVGATASSSPLSVLLVTIDTLRADHLGCYNGPDAESLTPTVDRLAADGLRFENAVVPMVVTDPSHASMLTGLYPEEHGVVRNSVQLDPAATTVTEVLAAAGLRTGAAISVSHMDAHPSAFSQGFDTYYDRGGHDRFRYHAGWKGLPRRVKARVFAHERAAVETNERAVRFLDAVSGEPFFLWVHYFEPHTPYVGEDGRVVFRESDREALERAAASGDSEDLEATIAGLYRDEVRRADRALGELLAALDARGLSAGTAVIVVGDHGEHMHERRLPPDLWFGHSDVYEETCRVPLVLWRPGVVEAGVRDKQVSVMDLAGTILELAGVEAQWSPGGTVLSGAPRESRPLVVEANPHVPVEATALRAGRWKLIARPGGRAELYDLAADPGETSNIVDLRRPLADSLGAELAGIVQGWGPRARPEEPDEATREMLRSLGYLE